MTSKLGVIAGQGKAPLYFIDNVQRLGYDVVVIALRHVTDSQTVRETVHLWIDLGQLEQPLQWLHEQEVTDIVMVGSVRFPSLKELCLDRKAMGYLARYGVRALFGDATLLKIVISILQQEGFCVKGVQDILATLLMPLGVLGEHRPDEQAYRDIQRGRDVAFALGNLDIGQSVVVQQGIVLGVEAVEGTDQLLARCAPLRRQGSQGVLVKISKPQQDLRADLPTIGPTTVHNAIQAGLRGIALEGKRSLVVSYEETKLLADRHHFFLIGIL